jgi:hypothetical protein
MRIMLYGELRFVRLDPVSPVSGSHRHDLVANLVLDIAGGPLLIRLPLFIHLLQHLVTRDRKLILSSSVRHGTRLLTINGLDDVLSIEPDDP